MRRIHRLVVVSACACALFVPPDTYGAVPSQPPLDKLGVSLKVTRRPAPPKPSTLAVAVTLTPQGDAAGSQIASFGVPFAPDVLQDDKRLRVTAAGPAGGEIAVFTRPLAHWWIDGKKGSIRSVLVQIELTFQARQPQRVTVTWDAPRALHREREAPAADTQFVRNDGGFDFHSPRVLATLPPEWLCESLVAWQQVPARANKVAAWFDEHLMAQFPNSLKHLAAPSAGPHLYDRPATYAKIYVRHGGE